MANKKGGGIGSRQHRSVGVRNGTARPRGQNPRWTSQIGQSYGNKAMNRPGMMPTEKVIEKRRTGEVGLGARLGNELALNVGKGGPGTGRTLYGQSGSNQTYGPVAGSPKPQGRPILSEFGGESKPRR